MGFISNRFNPIDDVINLMLIGLAFHDNNHWSTSSEKIIKAAVIFASAALYLKIKKPGAGCPACPRLGVLMVYFLLMLTPL